jgi:riboflavin kinase / FMN adenylyltransferase
MRVIRHWAQADRGSHPRFAAIGAFDAMHVGHQRVLRQLVERSAADRATSLVVLRQDRRVADGLALSSLRQQLETLSAVGVELGCICQGVAAANVCKALGIVLVVSEARAVPVPPGVALDRVDTATLDGIRISSDRVRSAVEAADLDAAHRLLGHPYRIGGRVIHGFHRGASIGIPTANLRVRGMHLPPDGVYAVTVSTGGRELRGVANIGFNPTFGNRQRSVETHLLDFTGNLYGVRLEISFHAHLRAERRFASVEALVAQILADIAAARQLFTSHVEPR